MTAFESELLCELTVGMENGLGMSENFDHVFFFGTGDGVKSRVSWGCLLGRKGGGGWVTGKSRLSMICFN